MRILGLINGEVVDINANVLTIEDRGHQFGDGVYEVTRVYNKRPFALKEHIQRLERSLEGLRIPLPFSVEEIRAFHQRLIAESEAEDALVYLQITRGAAPRIHYFPDTVSPTLTMTIRPVRVLAAQLKEQGAKAVLVPDERWLRCHIKSLNLLGNIVAKQVAQEKGCFEAIMYRDQFVTEGSSSNVFVVKEGILYTHPTTHLILPGITRRMVIDTMMAGGYVVKEETFTPDFLFDADEVFLSGTTTEIMPIISIDDRAIGNGQVGPVTRYMQQRHEARINQECER